MRRTTLFTLGAAVLATAAVGLPPAHAFTPVIVGELCGMTMTRDPIVGGDRHVAEVHGGPVAGYDADEPTAVSEMYIFCSVQVGGSGRASDPDVTVLEAWGPEAAFIPPTRVAFDVPDGARTFYCVEIWVATPSGHASVYLDSESGAWVGSPENARCDTAISVGGGGVGGGPLPGGPTGPKCAFNSATDLTREAGWQLGHVRGGPLATGEDGTLVCEIHVNNNTHDGFAVASHSASAVGGVVLMEPRVLSYPATAADTVSLCTTWVGASGTLYWRSGAPGNNPKDLGSWETSPTSCNEAISGMYDPMCAIWLAVDRRAGTNIAEIWQDCEGSEPII